ncbi:MULTISPECIES: YtcA family lipoprotein [Enterobacteriaceae]|uniref:YtcA family lipoprotein n=1 Tax=Enterobacteriaceae TaxID=543 RepID=UPI0015DBD36E|nr:YtcA family lipoprotein [Klebsiella sp. WP8-S18-ESBL-06]BBT72982.1 hypothetical protein WP8S18E06_42810 [Klebsiella sp. WP8-S18-ESBL-06]
MQIVKSRAIRSLIKGACFTPLVMLAGCSLPPAIPFIGAYYPGWLLCMIVGVILTLLSRRILLRKRHAMPLAGVVYTALFALYSMLFWLVFF